jgi:hypothetical protein
VVTDDVSDGLRLDFPLRVFRGVVDVTVGQCMGVSVDRRRRQVGVVLVGEATVTVVCGGTAMEPSRCECVFCVGDRPVSPSMVGRRRPARLLVKVFVSAEVWNPRTPPGGNRTIVREDSLRPTLCNGSCRKRKAATYEPWKTVRRDFELAGVLYSLRRNEGTCIDVVSLPSSRSSESLLLSGL